MRIFLIMLLIMVSSTPVSNAKDVPQEAKVSFNIVCAQERASCLQRSNSRTGEEFWVKKTASLSTQHIASTAFKKNLINDNVPSSIIELTLTNKGQKRLKKVTTKHNGKQLAVSINNDVMMAPVIAAPITGNTLQIAVASQDFAQSFVEAFNKQSK